MTVSVDGCISGGVVVGFTEDFSPDIACLFTPNGLLGVLSYPLGR